MTVLDPGAASGGSRSKASLVERPAAEGRADEVRASGHRSPLERQVALVYAGAAFLGTWVFFIWLILFLGNLPKGSDPWLPVSVDHRPSLLPPVAAAAVDAVLISIFALQHSVMARPAIKTWMSRRIPTALERATYVHAANAAGFLLLALWQPIPIELWHIAHPWIETALWFLFAAGWLLLLAAALSIGMAELLGFRQARSWSLGRAPRPLALRTGRLYGVMAHPMYAGVILGLWMTPEMSLGHALLALTLTAYIAIGMRFERRDLERRYGAAYDGWRGGRAQGR